MVKVGFLFPGQGAQTVGMGKDFYDTYDCAKQTYNRANEILGFDLKSLCFEGPEDILRQTINAQVAIYTTSIAILRVIQELYPDIKPSVACGLSLGEYSALVASEIIDFENGLSLVQQRGKLMEQAATLHKGTMLSIIGLDEKVCKQIANDCDVDVANYNSLQQIVLSGNESGILKAHDIALEKGAKKAIVLNVSGAFHSRLMNSAALAMRSVLNEYTFNQPCVDFIPNVKAVAVDDSDRVKECLVEQVDHSVKWTQSFENAVQNGIKTFLEIGPGSVLKGLARRINKEASVVSVSTVDDCSSLDKLLLT